MNDIDYRYLLTRDWRTDETEPAVTALFIMLNPSTATEGTDDPTIRRCIGFAKREGCNRLEVVNLYAMRATRPAKLLAVTDRVAAGRGNKLTIIAALNRRPQVAVAAWGAWHDQNRDRSSRGFARLNVEGFAKDDGIDLRCLGTTRSGAPRHPLYVRNDQPLVAYPP